MINQLKHRNDQWYDDCIVTWWVYNDLFRDMLSTQWYDDYAEHSSMMTYSEKMFEQWFGQLSVTEATNWQM